MYYFLVNTTGGSGKTKRAWMDIKAVLAAHDVTYKAFQTKGDDHVRSLAGRISRIRDDDDIRLIVVGGDGTINNVINGIRDFERVSLGVIPTGSGNDFARGLGVKGSPTEVMEEILKAGQTLADDSGADGTVRQEKAGGSKTKRIDLGKVCWDGGERLFAISGGIGLDALVCKQALTSRAKKVLNKIGLGQMIYSLLTVKDLFTMRYLKGAMYFTGDSGAVQETMAADKLIFAAAMNFSCEGGGVPMAPDASAEDGKLSVCAAVGVPRWQTFLKFPKLLAAKHQSEKGFVIRDCAQVSVELEEPAVIHADGEYVGEYTKAIFTCLPQKLRCIRPGD